MHNAKTLKIVTLGCRVNQYESEYIRQGFERLGYRDAAEGEQADLCVVNGCVVTAESEAKTRKAIRRLARKHPRAEIIVVGCYAARSGEEAASLPGVVEVIPDKRRLPEFFARRGLPDAPAGIDRFPSRRRAYVKVQDGCRGRCAYCIIPTVRPYMTSRPVDEVLDEINRLVAGGHREIVLTGIHLGAYEGRGTGGWGRGAGDEGLEARDGNRVERIRTNPQPPAPSPQPLAALVRAITDLPGEFRLRLSSIEAAEVTPELIALMAERRERICPFLHLPLQSGSEPVLRRMNRPTSAADFAGRCREIRSSLGHPAICTDIIVGFPGETDEDFAATCRMAETVGFAKIHIFRFSPRPGTSAATMPEQVTNRIVQQRAAELGKLAADLRTQFCRSLIGRELQVMVESTTPETPGQVLGTSEYHVPVAFPGDSNMIGKFVRVTAQSVEDGRIVGVID